jgi:hypothetical protein
MNYFNKIYLIIDLDWAIDQIFEHIIEFLDLNNIKATFFITHETKLLAYLRKNPNFELGLHPNFKPLFYLSDKNTNYDINSILKNLKNIVPEAKSVRTHCLVQSSILDFIYPNYNLSHAVNLFLPISSNIVAKPFINFNNMINVPFCWEDDIHCHYIKKGIEIDWTAEKYANLNQLTVIAFHPIHFFLNLDNLDRYELCRPYLNNISFLKRNINKSDGVKTFITDFCKRIKDGDKEFDLIKNISI